MVEFLENISAFSLKHSLQSLAEEKLFFVYLIKKVFVAEENPGFYKRELLQHHESFQILAFEGSLSIGVAL